MATTTLDGRSHLKLCGGRREILSKRVLDNSQNLLTATSLQSYFLYFYVLTYSTIFNYLLTYLTELDSTLNLHPIYRLTYVLTHPFTYVLIYVPADLLTYLRMYVLTDLHTD